MANNEAYWGGGSPVNADTEAFWRGGSVHPATKPLAGQPYISRVQGVPGMKTWGP